MCQRSNVRTKGRKKKAPSGSSLSRRRAERSSESRKLPGVVAKNLDDFELFVDGLNLRLLTSFKALEDMTEVPAWVEKAPVVVKFGPFNSVTNKRNAVRGIVSVANGFVEAAKKAGVQDGTVEAKLVRLVVQKASDALGRFASSQHSTLDGQAGAAAAWAKIPKPEVSEDTRVVSADRGEWFVGGVADEKASVLSVDSGMVVAAEELVENKQPAPVVIEPVEGFEYPDERSTARRLDAVLRVARANGNVQNRLTAICGDYGVEGISNLLILLPKVHLGLAELVSQLKELLPDELAVQADGPREQNLKENSPEARAFMLMSEIKEHLKGGELEEAFGKYFELPSLLGVSAPEEALDMMKEKNTALVIFIRTGMKRLSL